MNVKERLSGLLGLAVRAHTVVFGTEACLRKIIRKEAAIVFAGRDADSSAIEKIENKASAAGIPVITLLSGEEIASAIGREKIKVAVVCDRGFAGSMKRLTEDGEKDES